MLVYLLSLYLSWCSYINIYLLGFRIDSGSVKENIKRLTTEYWNHKGFYNFPYKYKGSKAHFNNCVKSILCLSLDYELQRPNLTFVKIQFDTPVFDKVTKDRSAKFVDMLSAIGGTMGLLTGFSIISGVEIIYFAVRIVLDYIKRMKRSTRLDIHGIN